MVEPELLAPEGFCAVRTLLAALVQQADIAARAEATLALPLTMTAAIAGSTANSSRAEVTVRTMGSVRLFSAFGRLSRMMPADPRRSMMTSSVLSI